MIAVVEYRHSGIAPFPAQAIDTRNAIRYMKLHAKEYKADVNQMFVAGDSSGGHTAFFSQLIREDGNVNIYLRETADMNIYPDVDASVKGIISLYGALSVMLEDGMPSTLIIISQTVRREWKWVVPTFVIIRSYVVKCRLSVI